jgi:1,4-alpha-glucan branching enzyme
MMMKNVYLLLAGLLLVSVTSCSKKSVSKNNSGNDTVSTVVNPNGKDVPAGATDGVTFINNGASAIFDIYAPGKKSFYLVGDFNSWSETATPMNNTKDGTRWWVEVDNLNPNTEYSYQYFIDGSLTVADPYSHKILDKANDPYIPASVYPNLKAFPSGATGNIVSDFQYNAPAYTWTTTSFTPVPQKNLVVYELLVRDFVATHSYQTLVDTLNYIARLGVNAIELMPVSEFEGNDSWGYNSNFMFALDKYYGTANAYKAFIDACHARGIAVIMDMVLEDQFGSSPMCQMYWNAAASQPAANSPWFDQTTMHPDGVGYQLNHSTAATQYWAENVMKYWVQEYHIDGYRFDEAKGYTQVNSGTDETAWAAYDPTRVALWAKYNTYMKNLNSNLYVILEMFSANNEEATYANAGMMCWNDESTPGEQCTMGYATGPVWDISGLFYDAFGFSSTLPAPYGLVGYFESHDEERLQFKNEAYGNDMSPGYQITSIPVGLARDEEGAAFMFSSPGPKMVWMGGELGYDVSINATSDRTADKPFNWTYNTQADRLQLYGIYAKMIKMKIKNPVFATTNFTYSLTGPVKTIQLLDPTADVEVIGNFDIVAQPTVITFPSTGTWYDNITGTSINVTTNPYSVTLAPGEYHVYSNVALQQ